MHKTSGDQLNSPPTLRNNAFDGLFLKKIALAERYSPGFKNLQPGPKWQTEKTEFTVAGILRDALTYVPLAKQGTLNLNKYEFPKY